jgi:chaperonin GroES
MQIQPLQDRVLVEVLEAEAKTKSGLVLPDTAKERPQKGKVVAVGKGKVADDGKLIQPEVKIGDKVLYKKYSGNEVKIEEKDYLLLEADDIVAVIK